MAKKILFCASIQGHIRKFHTPYLKLFKEKGYEIHVAGKDTLSSRKLKLDFADKLYDIDFKRSPFRLSTVETYLQLKKIIEKNNYDIIHCHTPVVGVLARLAARKSRKKGTRVLYTAHGFHFYKGAPVINWLVYYPIEKFMSRYTDSLITINTEDYDRAIKSGFKAKNIVHVKGVGVNIEEFVPADLARREKLRRKFNYGDDNFLMFYAAEFNANKNQELLIKAMARIKTKIPKAKLLLAGRGSLMEKDMELARELNVEDRVDFLGYRRDIPELLPMCDIVVASSLREGLPVNLLESMACAKPIVATINRGHRELVIDGFNGFLVDAHDELAFSQRILELYSNPEMRKIMGENSLDRVTKYTLDSVYEQMKNMYRKVEV